MENKVSHCSQDVKDVLHSMMGGNEDWMNYMCTTGKQGKRVSKFVQNYEIHQKTMFWGFFL